METKLYEVFLKIRTISTDTETSYSEVWRICNKNYQPAWTPQLTQVIKTRNKDVKPPSISTIYQVLLEIPTHAHTQKDVFELGKHLIKEYLEEKAKEHFDYHIIEKPPKEFIRPLKKPRLHTDMSWLKPKPIY